MGFGEIGSDIAHVASSIGSSKGSESGVELRIPTSESVDTASLQHCPAQMKMMGAGSVKGFGRIVTPSMRAPMAFTLAMTQGAHNLPRAWGDKTVRPQDKITGVGSGLWAAGKVSLRSCGSQLAELDLQPLATLPLYF